MRRMVFQPNKSSQAKIVVEKAADRETADKTVEEIAHKIQKIGYEGWRSTPWIKKVASKHNLSADALARQIFFPEEYKVASQAKKIKRAKENRDPRHAVYWSAAYIEKSEKPLSSVPAAGFAKMEYHLQGPAALKLLKKTINRGVYAYLHDLVVVPRYQGVGIGTALLYCGLSEYPRHLRPVLTTLKRNHKMQVWAERYGYVQTSEIPSSGLLEEVGMSLVRYEAPSVGQVLSQIEELNPWLNQAV